MTALMSKGAMNLQMISNSCDCQVELEEEEDGKGGQVVWRYVVIGRVNKASSKLKAKRE